MQLKVRARTCYHIRAPRTGAGRTNRSSEEEILLAQFRSGRSALYHGPGAVRAQPKPRGAHLKARCLSPPGSALKPQVLPQVQQ